MDYKKKYKESLERATQKWECGDMTRECLEYIFTELAESEDERIRKYLLSMFPDPNDLWDGISARDIIAWLEKQGEHQNFRDKIQIGDQVTRNEDGVLVNLSQLKRVAKPADIAEKQGEKKHFDNYKDAIMDVVCHYVMPDDIDEELRCIVKGEQKPADKIQIGKEYKCIASPRYSTFMVGKIYKPEDKFLCGLMNFCSDCFEPANMVEPKFKEGDWVVSPNGVYWHIDAINNNRYEVSSTDGACADWPLDTDLYHLWTIQDAKDGDVLYLQKDGKEHIIIYKGVIKERFRTFVSAYCAYNGIVDAFCFADVSRYVDIAYGGITPATKKQREKLEKAMTDAGYTFDFEKKELKKIEQNPAWSEEDDKILEEIIWYVEKGGKLIFAKNDNLVSWLKSLKERYTWKPSDLPHWQKSNLPNDNTTGFNSDYFCHKGYYINYKELFEKLPKDD